MWCVARESCMISEYRLLLLPTWATTVELYCLKWESWLLDTAGMFLCSKAFLIHQSEKNQFPPPNVCVINETCIFLSVARWEVLSFREQLMWQHSAKQPENDSLGYSRRDFVQNRLHRYSAWWAATVCSGGDDGLVSVACPGKRCAKTVCAPQPWSLERFVRLGCRSQERCSAYFGAEEMIRLLANQRIVFKNTKGCCKEEGSNVFLPVHDW